jgi:hypothetical protein
MEQNQTQSQGVDEDNKIKCCFKGGVDLLYSFVRSVEWQMTDSGDKNTSTPNPTLPALLPKTPMMPGLIQSK